MIAAGAPAAAPGALPPPPPPPLMAASMGGFGGAGMYYNAPPPNNFDDNLLSYSNVAPVSHSSLRNRAMPQQQLEQINSYKNAVNLDDDFDAYNEAQQRSVPLTEMGETKEYCETHYYNSKLAKCWDRQVFESEFWADYAEHCINNSKLKSENKKPFLSSAFTNAYHNLTEIIACLSLLDLPYRSVQHGFRTLEGRSAELKAASNMIIFKKEVKETKDEIRSNILVAQRFVDWEFRGDEDSLIDEYLVNHIYTGQVIITNISSKKLEFDVLVQIPQGSLPIGVASYQKSHSLALGNNKLNFKFYFLFCFHFRQLFYKKNRVSILFPETRQIHILPSKCFH